MALPGLSNLERRGQETWLRRVQRSSRRLPPVETILAIAGGAVLWVIIAAGTEDYILPQLHVVLLRIVELFVDSGQRWDWMVTMIRILLGIITAFFVGTIAGLAMGKSQRLSNVLMPYMQIIQGIPSLAWVMIAIIWFQEVEVRIWFLLLMVCLTGFAFQAKDSYRAIPKELRDMAKSLRPRRSRLDMFRTVTLPGIVPDLLTAWKVNLGLGTRVVLIAEFAGATIGVGYQLRIEQQFFRMDGVLAWTASLVIFVLIIQKIIELVERRLLRYRPTGDAPQVSEAGQKPVADSDDSAPALQTEAAGAADNGGRRE